MHKTVNQKQYFIDLEIRGDSRALVRGEGEVIILQNLITKRKQLFLQHKFKSSIFKTGANIQSIESM
jgi:hypothetical protein